MRIELVSLFPDYFRGPLEASMLKRAIAKGLIEVGHVDIRDFAENKHGKVDDAPYGGGPGMVLMPGPVSGAVQSCKRAGSYTVFLTPQGQPLTAALARELSTKEHLIFLCGHYEGIDQRAIDREVDLEVSVGDFVLTNGCLAALVCMDAMVRFLPGVLGDKEAAECDSFEEGVLEGPQYTRPEVFEGMEVPGVLRSGNHAAIAKWRKEQSLEKTRRVRPDLYRRCYATESADSRD